MASRETVTVVKAHQAAVGNEATVDAGEQVDVIENTGVDGKTRSQRVMNRLKGRN